MKPSILNISAVVRVLTVLAMTMVAVSTAYSQERKITPVETDDKKPEQPVLHYYDKHGNALKEPVLFLTEMDTVKKVSAGPLYPALTSVSVGINIFDAAMRIFGQKHSGIDVWGNISLFNWFLPTVEAGIGFGKKEVPEYTYTAKPSIYVKVGFDYNFLYKSNPDYMAFAGFRAGFSSFRYDVDNVTITSEYWDQTNRFSLSGVLSTAFYGQALLGLKVKIYKNFSMGWSGRYNFMFHRSGNKGCQPWYIPGYGANNRVSATFSLIYTIPLCNISEIRNQGRVTAKQN